ncbi:hypothetical protein KLMA_70267 [Kluyveromyces marxianus DMKU3-1042]|uniref:Uncharacterized protein n=1 Tax=Kluyveromyces marxianus (strain DMKU3-1042 / BCC 29191 / NBRC 104275) TaxID=1003335 RepID=W0TFF7_KLUMD|nr:hypothetical protein KLMA_70267 [Kluyveromyces marxianus DMKU3-1042]BAO42115.1 hypothetical protein KLMA_70267 [Kluyveromyces marxianus DMKU3-1042]
MTNNYNDFILAENLKDVSLDNSLQIAAITGDISYENEIERFKYPQPATRSKDELTKGTLVNAFKECSIEYEASRRVFHYLVKESNIFRFLFTNAHMTVRSAREPIIGSDQLDDIYIKATDDRFSSDMILSIHNGRVLQLATFVLTESSTQVKILDRITLPKLGCASKFTIVGDKVKGSQFLCLCQSLNTLSVLFFDIHVDHQETIKLISHDRQLILPRSKLLYGSMMNRGRSLKSSLLAIWNCNRVHLIYFEWNEISDEKHTFRLVLPNFSAVTRITYLNDSLFLIASEQEQEPILITSSQLKTGDREFKTISTLFNFINMEAECHELLDKLQRLYPQQLASFKKCMILLINHRDILVVISGKGDDVVYSHFLRVKFAVKFYVIDIDDKSMCIDILSNKGIQKHKIPLMLGNLYPLSEDFSVSQKAGNSVSETVYKSYSTVSSFVSCNREETKSTLWCSGNSGIYQIDKDGYYIQLVEEIESASYIGFARQHFVLKCNCRHLEEENRTFVIIYLGEEVTTRIVSMNEDGKLIIAKEDTLDFSLNILNEHTVNIFTLSESLFQVLDGCILEIKPNRERTVCFGDKTCTDMQIISCVGVDEYSEIAMLLKVGDDGAILFSVQEFSYGKLIEKWKQWLGHGTAKPIRHNAGTGTLHFEIESGSKIVSYTYDISHKELQMETWNLEEDCMADFAQTVINYGLNGNRRSLYTQTVRQVGRLKRFGNKEEEEEHTLFFSDEVCQLVQIADNCVLIHDSTRVGLLMNGTIVRVPGIENDGISSILEASAVVEHGAVVLLCVVFDTHTTVVRGTFVSNIVRSHDVKAKHNRTHLQRFCYFESLKRMVVCNLQKQVVYALKLETGKTASLEYASVRDLRHIYHLSEVEPNHAAIVGVTRNGAHVVKLCKISFKSGRLRMRDVGELELASKPCNGTASTSVNVSKRWATAPELWIAAGRNVRVVKLLLPGSHPGSHPGAHVELKLDVQLELGLELEPELDSALDSSLEPDLELVLSPTLICVKSNSEFYIGRINEVMSYKASALRRCEGTQRLEPRSSHALLHPDADADAIGSLVIWGNNRSTAAGGEGTVLLFRAAGPQPPVPAAVLSVPPDPVDADAVSVCRPRDSETRSTFKILHVTGRLTTIAIITAHGNKNAKASGPNATTAQTKAYAY